MTLQLYHGRATYILQNIFWIVVLLFGGCSAGREDTAERAGKPNIIIIMADDLGYNDLGVYGQQRINTPHLDRMAKEGIRFTNFYAGSTVCAPSRSVLMTGQHTGRTHVRGNREIQPMGQEPLPDSTVTIAEVLKKVGYATGLTGKWGLGGPGSTGVPNKQGFDHFFGYLCQRHAHNYYPEFLFRNEEEVKLNNEVNNSRTDGAGVATRKETYSHDLILEEALEFIERSSGQPFFLMLTPTLPHANNEGGDEGMEVPDQGLYADNDWPENEKNFAAMVTLLDEGVGAVFAKLDTLGLDENTLVIFTSDNGPHSEGGHDPDYFDSNGPFRGIKRDLYEGGIRVPMIARWPGKIKGGQVSDHMGYSGDFLATVAELSGADVPENTQSVSLVPTLLGREDQSEHPYLYWEFFEGNPHQAVRSGKWKAVRQPIFTGATELYDLSEDAGEENDIADEHPDVVRRMEEMMAEAHRPSDIWGGE